MEGKKKLEADSSNQKELFSAKSKNKVLRRARTEIFYESLLDTEVVPDEANGEKTKTKTVSGSKKGKNYGTFNFGDDQVVPSNCKNEIISAALKGIKAKENTRTFSKKIGDEKVVLKYFKPSNGVSVPVRVSSSESLKFEKHMQFKFKHVKFNVQKISASHLEAENQRTVGKRLLFEVKSGGEFRITAGESVIEINAPEDINAIFQSDNNVLLVRKAPASMLTFSSRNRPYTMILMGGINNYEPGTGGADIVPSKISLTALLGKFNDTNQEQRPMKFLKKDLSSLNSKIKGKGHAIAPIDFYSKPEPAKKEPLDKPPVGKTQQRLDSMNLRRNPSRDTAGAKYSDSYQDIEVIHTDKFEKLRYAFKDKRLIEISVADYSTLYNRQWINDTMIDFFLKYYVEKAVESGKLGAHEAYVMTSYFFTKLMTTGPKEDYYPTISRWLRKLELCKYRYIIMPINEEYHWYCAVIYNFSEVVARVRNANVVELEPDPERPDPNKVTIYCFDSLGQTHGNVGKPITASLIGYAKDVLDIEISESDFVVTEALVPKQKNLVDCGIHVIYNVKQFFDNIDKVLGLWTNPPKRAGLMLGAIFGKGERERMRVTLRSTLLELEGKQQEGFDESSEKKCDDSDVEEVLRQSQDGSPSAEPATEKRASRTLDDILDGSDGESSKMETVYDKTLQGKETDIANSYGQMMLNDSSKEHSQEELVSIEHLDVEEGDELLVKKKTKGKQGQDGDIIRIDLSNSRQLSHTDHTKGSTFGKQTAGKKLKRGTVIASPDDSSTDEDILPVTSNNKLYTMLPVTKTRKN